MPNINQVTLAGHLTRDAELRYTPSGAAVCETGLAVNRKYKAGDEWKTEVAFVDVVSFGKPAEWLGECRRGQAVFISGFLKFEQWEGKDGTKRSKLKVQAADFCKLLSEKSEPAPQRDAPKAEPKEDDIPF